MNNKETEDLISNMLNSPKPDKNVLASAKNFMAQKKPIMLRIKRQFYALASCSAVFIIIGFVFVVLNQAYNNGYKSGLAANANEHAFLISALASISFGVILAIVAIILRIKKVNKIK